MTELPEEGKVVAVPPDCDPVVKQALGSFEIPVVVSPYVPSGTMLVLDLDAIFGKTPLPVRTQQAAELLMERMRELAASGRLPATVVRGIGTDRPDSGGRSQGGTV